MIQAEKSSKLFGQTQGSIFQGMIVGDEGVMKKSTIKAVYDDNLEELLKDLGLLHKFKRGELKCAFSKDVITLHNLHSIFPDSGDVKFCCSNPDCIRQLLLKREKKSRG